MPQDSTLETLPPVFLIGAGVVGTAIAQSHLDAGVAFCIGDQDADVLQQAAQQLVLPSDNWSITQRQIPGLSLPGLCVQDESIDIRTRPWIVIESVVERLDVKQTLFNVVGGVFGASAAYCSNTSNLRIADIAAGLNDASGFCGMHFFMPVTERHAVEIVGHDGTSQPTLTRASTHARRLNKEPIEVADGPGFLVNRMLSPYINQSMLLLTTGASADQIAAGAAAFGMPMSPLELIDWIGSRTLFHAGRAFWQAFPHRLSPSPMVAGLVKNDRPGRAAGRGFYDYVGGLRSENLAPITRELIERYRTDQRVYSLTDIEHLLAIPMWIEGIAALAEGVANGPEQIDIAMRCGLGYRHPLGWNGYFEALGKTQMDSAIAKWSDAFASMRMPSPDST
ncbi:3-hydroxyacyl-CoA dehydrogenase [Stieleria varia]|uniref:3-hydroxyacyl-CoA dehydrogenase n=1 Tax=Stieleria varia TaxID=2528005 RepID=UPI0018D21886|nr:3-hydroxyacyl-CoA dehydrogenase [Stieleria varia]